MGIGLNATNPNYLLFVDGSAGKPGGGSWTNSSDRRLKDNINPYAHGLDEIKRIDPVTFQYNELSGYDTAPEHVGVIAQELQEVAPYMVSTNKNSGYLDVNNSAMTYMLVNAVKELSDENELLKSHIEEQSQMIMDLQKQFEEFQAQLQAPENAGHGTRK